MKEILTGIKEEVPRFVTHFYKTLTAPRTYPLGFVGKGQKEESSVAAALIFFILCILLNVVFLAPIYGLTESWNLARLSYSIIIDCLALVLAAGALKVAWRFHKGIVSYQTYLILFSYIFGTLLSVFHFVNLVGFALLYRYEPVYYRYLIDSSYLGKATTPPFDSIAGHPAAITRTVLVWALLIFCLSWFYIAWANFRKANMQTRKEGIGAAIIFTGMITVVWFIITIIAPMFFTS